MGLDYSVLLFFERQDPWQILEGVAEFAEHGIGKHTAIAYPDQLMRLPFEAWAGTEKLDPIPYNDQSKSWEFMTSLLFEKDAEVQDYADRYDLDRGPEQKRVAIGYIYLTVYNNWEGYSDCWDPGQILFQFAAATSNMSIMMAQSMAVRKPFAVLLKRYRGLYGVIDREMDGVLFWLRGKEMDVDIPDSWMGIQAIDDYLDRYGE
jgi:hypothetical protein